MFESEAVGVLPPADVGSAFTNSPMGVALATPSGVVIAANDALGELLGVPAEELRGATLFAFTHPDDLAGATAACRELQVSHGRMRHESRMRRPDGDTVPVQVTSSWVDGAAGEDPPHLVMVVEDVTERKALEARLLHLSAHDPLTGLPNRLLFRDRLRHALERGHREHTPTCVLVLDLDGFKAINDEHGHSVGDRAIQAVAQVLVDSVRDTDLVCRYGGEEFCIALPGIDIDSAMRLAERLRRRVEAECGPIVFGSPDGRMTTSVGVASVRLAARDAAGLVDLADQALYAAKKSGRNRVVRFDRLPEPVEDQPVGQPTGQPA